MARNRRSVTNAVLPLLFFYAAGSVWAAGPRQSNSAGRAATGLERTAARTTNTRAVGTSASPKEKNRAATHADDAAVGQWTLIGPQPLIGPDGKSYTGTMAHSGLVNAAAVDPRNSSVVYLGTAGGGVWKTTDGGQTWIPLTDNQPSLEIGALALDPSNPDTVYAGTSFSNSFFSNLGAGILKSSDGGATWTQLPGPLPTGAGLPG